jgi:hypothetical protein
MWRARFLVVSWLAGAAVGCGGALAPSDGGTGGAGGFTPEVYTWSGGTVTVAPTGATAEGLTLLLEQGATVMFLPSMATPLPNGSYLTAHYDCSTPGLYEVGIYSCTDQSGSGRTTVPECMALVLASDHVRGNYIDAKGDWEIVSAIADVHLPPQEWRGGLPGEAATGNVIFEGRNGDGDVRTLQTIFSLPMRIFQLLC